MPVTPGEGVVFVTITNAICPKCKNTKGSYPNFPRGAFLMDTKRYKDRLVCRVENWEPEDFWMSCRGCDRDWHSKFDIKEG